jgi:hypothetical protein
MTDKNLETVGWIVISGLLLAFVLMGERRFKLWIDKQLNDILPGGQQ